MFHWVGNNVGGLLALWGCLVAAVGGVWCVRAARRVRVKRQCLGCSYDMEGIAGLVCPECGDAAKSEAVLLRRRVNRRWLAVCVLGFVGSAASWVVPEVRSGRWVGWVPTSAIIWGLPYLDEKWSDPPTWSALLRSDLLERCYADDLQPAQWQELVRIAIDDEERRASKSHSARRDFAHGPIVAAAENRGHLTDADRTRLDRLCRIRFSQFSPAVSGAFWFAVADSPWGWPETSTYVDFVDPSTGEKLDSYYRFSGFAIDLSPPWFDGLRRIAFIRDGAEPTCVRVIVKTDTFRGGTWQMAGRTMLDYVEELPSGPVLPEGSGVRAVLNRDVAEALIQSATVERFDWMPDREQVWVVVNPALAQSVIGPEIDTLALRIEVLFDETVVGVAEAWWPAAGRQFGESFSIETPIAPRPSTADLSRFRVRLVGDARVALRNPQGKVCWEGSVVVKPPDGWIGR